MRVSARRVAGRHLMSKNELDLRHYHLEGLPLGEAVTLYHGTTRLFRHFDLSLSRTELVERFYGGGLFFTPSKMVASQYAMANRNMGFPPSIIADLKSKNPGAGAFLAALYAKGNSVWDEWNPEAFGVPPEQYAEEFARRLGGVDPNTVADVARWISGSKIHEEDLEREKKEQEERGYSLGPMDLFGGGSTGMPDWAYDDLDKLGLNSKTYRPKIYTVTVQVPPNKTLVTKNKTQARNAKKRGFEAVVFYGSDLVSGIPEVAVFNPARVRIKKIEVVQITYE